MYNRVIKPTLFAIVFGFIFASLLLAPFVIWGGMTYKPESIFLGNIIGSVFVFLFHYIPYKRELKRGTEV